MTLRGVSWKRMRTILPRVFSERSNKPSAASSLRHTRPISYLQAAFAVAETVCLSLWFLASAVYTKIYMLVRFLAVTTILSCLALVTVLFTTNPSSAGLTGMLAVFLLGYLSLLGVVAFLLYYGSRLFALVVKSFGGRTRHTRMALGRAYLYGSVLAALPMMAVGLYSTGGIAWYEGGLLLLFGLMGVLYVARRT